MPFVLTSASKVTCGHIPPATGVFAVPSTAKLRVAGASALRAADLTAVTITVCGTVGASEVPCTKVDAIATGPAAKLRSGGVPVLLDTLKGGTNGKVGGTPQLLLGGTAIQTKLKAT